MTTCRSNLLIVEEKLLQHHKKRQWKARKTGVCVSQEFTRLLTTHKHEKEIVKALRSNVKHEWIMVTFQCSEMTIMRLKDKHGIKKDRTKLNHKYR